MLALAAERGRISSGTAGDARLALERFGFDEYQVDWSECLATAFTTRLTAYDAQYLRLAQDCGAPLWTVDSRLGSAATGLGLLVEP